MKFKRQWVRSWAGILLPFLPASAAPVEQWVARYDPPGHGQDEAKAVAVDPSGDIYLAGSTNPWNAIGSDLRISDAKTISNRDVLLAKCSPEGELLWTRRYDGPDSDEENARLVVIDGRGDVIVAGSAEGARPDQSRNLLVLKYDQEGQLLWRRIIEGDAERDEDPVALAIDGDGSIVVAGNSQQWQRELRWSRKGRMFLARIGPDGDLLWRYEEGLDLDHFDDRAVGVGIDRSGKIRIAGLATMLLNGATWPGNFPVILQFASSGGLERTTVLDEVTSKLQIEEMPVAFALDDAGFSHLVAVTQGGISTWKLHPDGALDWRENQQPPLNSEVNRLRLALGPDGEIVVAGVSIEESWSGDRTDALWKYDLSGNERWEVPPFLTHRAPMQPFDLLVDRDGSIYLSGNWSVSEDSGYSPSWAKYSSDGQRLWLHDQGAPAIRGDPVIKSVALDGRGGLVAVGSIDDLMVGDALAVRVDSHGAISWARRIDGPGSGIAMMRDFLLDDSGNSYVTGYSYYNADRGYPYWPIVKFDGQGKLLWEIRYGYEAGPIPFESVSLGERLALDRNGDLLAAGAQFREAVILRLTPEGGTRWEARVPPLQFDYVEVEDFALDGVGNSFLIGREIGMEESDFLLAKTDPDGKVRWRVSYQDADMDYKIICGLAVDSMGNPLLVASQGTFEWDGIREPFMWNDFTILKYSPDGELLWEVREKDETHGFDNHADAFGFDPEGNLVVAGAFASRYLVAKYDPSGKNIWNRLEDLASRTLVNSPDGKDEFFSDPVQMAMDTSGDIYLAVRANAIAGNRINLRKYSASGDFIWEWSDGDLRPVTTPLEKLLLDRAGNVYLAGTLWFAGIPAAYSLFEVSPEGAELWRSQYNRGEYNQLLGLGVNRSGDLLAAGLSGPRRRDIAATLVKYSPRARFLRGDCNGDGKVDGVTEPITLLAYGFAGGARPPCLAACDIDGDGTIEGTVTDAIALIQHLFLGGPPPPPPYPVCGEASTGPLACESPPVCR